MRNRHPAICYRCGKMVNTGQGHFERWYGVWRTQHASCAIKYRNTDTHYIYQPIGKNDDKV